MLELSLPASVNDNPVIQRDPVPDSPMADPQAEPFVILDEPEMIKKSSFDPD